MATVGSYLATRLAQIGIKRHFVVPGDYNLVLLDKLQNEPGLDEINCSNELNCSMAAEGYARANGVAACVVTYSVGAFSAFNGIGSAFGENLPVILVSGAPNTNDAGDFNLLHHTLGLHDFQYQLEMARKITVAAVSIQRPSDAPRLVDSTIRRALRAKKPVYIKIPTNLANQPCASPGPASLVLDPVKSDTFALKEAIQKASSLLSAKEKVTILVGSKVRSAGAEPAVLALAEALGCAVVVMPRAKSFFPESHPLFAGVYWGQCSTQCAESIIDWSETIICAGTVFTDYSTVGWTAVPPALARLTADIDTVQFAGADYTRVCLVEFLHGLAHAVHKSGPDAPLTRAEMARQIHPLIDSKTTLLVDTGDAWFTGMSLPLPKDARFEIEMQWGHIGWSVPASLGCAVGAPDRQIITMVGDGSFQMTAQEVSQLVRLRIPVIFFLLNNSGYTIEVEIHDGIYNNIKNWDYAAFVESFNANDGHARGFHASTAKELHAAIKSAQKNKGGPSLIECTIDRDDCSKDLISWGHFVAVANARAPKIQ